MIDRQSKTGFVKKKLCQIVTPWLYDLINERGFGPLVGLKQLFSFFTGF